MRAKLLAALLVVLVAAPAPAQVQSLLIPAGTPEDQEIQTIGKEPDDAKRATLWEQFVAKYSANPAAVAYGASQLQQYYLAAGQAEKAMTYGDKAIAAVPNNLDILMSQTMAAQQLKDQAKVLHYAGLGGKAISGIKKTPPPEGVAAADWAANLEAQRQRVQQQWEFFEGVAYNAVASETNPKKRVSFAEEYTDSFPGGRYADQVQQLAITSLMQARDFAGLASYGEKALAANPDNVTTLSLLAFALAEDPSPRHLNKAIEHARKAIDLGKADAPDADHAIKLSVGLAHEALGYAWMKQEKTAAAVPEFKSAEALLKEDPGSRERVLYRLGYAYAKLKRTAEARETLNEVIAMKGAFAQSARDVLTKMSAPAKAQ